MKTQLTLDTQEVITPKSKFDQRLIYVANIREQKCVLIATKYNGSKYKWLITEGIDALLSSGNSFIDAMPFYESIKWAIDEMNGDVYTLSSIDEFADWLKD